MFTNFRNFRLFAPPRPGARARENLFFTFFHIWTCSELLQKKLAQNIENCGKKVEMGGVPP